MDNPLEECKGLLVRRWGELGGYWGINRTMAEIHALLFISGQPLCTDDIMAQLHISRGNTSMNLRGLVDWGLLRRVHKLGDRKEYFQADTDVWHMFETIMRERRRREVEPIIDTIERCRQIISIGSPSTDQVPAEAKEITRRLDELQRFLSTMGTLFELVLRFGPDGVDTLLQLTIATGSADQPSDTVVPAAAGKPRSRAKTGKRRTERKKS